MGMRAFIVVVQKHPERATIFRETSTARVLKDWSGGVPSAASAWD